MEMLFDDQGLHSRDGEAAVDGFWIQAFIGRSARITPPGIPYRVATFTRRVTRHFVTSDHANYGLALFPKVEEVELTKTWYRR